MSKDEGRKKTFGQKAARFFRRLTLCAAFGAAAGAGYEFYGTQQDVTAKVNAIEPTPSGDVIHTDRGAFVNAPTLAYMKNQDDVLAIAAKIKPGTTVEMHVYGLEKIGNKSLEDYGIHRNITGAVVIETPAPPTVVAPVAAPLVVPQPVVPEPLAPVPVAATPPAMLTVPPGLRNLVGVDMEDASLPEACAANDDFAAISSETPRLARDLDIMRQLPLTGTDVFNTMKDPANHMQSCLVPVAKDDESTTSTYKNHQARIARGTGTSVTFHEYFHAMQSVHEGRKNMYTLTKQDAVVANLLTEASAVAYEISARQEAENHGLKFYDPPVIKKTWEEGIFIYTETFSESSAATNPKTRAAFKEAYNTAFEANAGLEADARAAVALQAGGRAVVSYLLAGNDPNWNQTYVDLVIENVNGKPFREKGLSPGYAEKRDAVFRAQGAISSTINVVPEDYLGPDAQKAIQKAFTDVGFKWETPATPVPPAKSAGPSS